METKINVFDGVFRKCTISYRAKRVACKTGGSWCITMYEYFIEIQTKGVFMNHILSAYTVHAYAKINLSLDILGTLPNGYH